MIANSSIYGVAEAAVIMGGIITIAIIVGAIIIAAIREDNNRPVMPWSTRMRVEKAKAHTEIVQESLNQDALEVKRLGIEHHRTRVLEAMAEGDHDEVAKLTLGRSSSKDIERH